MVRHLTLSDVGGLKLNVMTWKIVKEGHKKRPSTRAPCNALFVYGILFNLMLVIQTSVEYTEVLRFLAAAARIKPVLRGFERRSRYYNLVESMRIAMELGDYSWVRDCQITMTEYAYALGMDKYRRILTELELKRRTLSEADFAASVYFAFIDMGSHYVAGDLLCEELNLIFQRRVKQHRSAQFWLNGISEASLRIAKTHPGCDLGRWQAKLTDQPFGSFAVNMVQVSTL